jgi:hypothetical protein
MKGFSPHLDFKMKARAERLKIEKGCGLRIRVTSAMKAGVDRVAAKALSLTNVVMLTEVVNTKLLAG